MSHVSPVNESGLKKKGKRKKKKGKRKKHAPNLRDRANSSFAQLYTAGDP